MDTVATGLEVIGAKSLASTGTKTHGKGTEIKDSLLWHGPCEGLKHGHRSDQNTNMKTAHRSPNENRHSTRLLILIGQFQMESFPVQVRGSQFEKIEPSANLSQAPNLEQGTIVRGYVAGKLKPMDIASRSAWAVSGAFHRVSTAS